MKAKYIFTLFTLLFIIQLQFKAQQIINVVVTPTNPITTDTIRVLITSTFPQGSCTGTVSVINSPGQVIANGFHCMGSNTVTCTDTDTIKLYPPHAAGTFTCIFSLDAGYWPGCSPSFVPYDHDTTFISIGTSTPTSISDTEILVKSFNFYPNPAKESITVNYIKPVGQNIELEIYDVRGLLVNKLMNLPEGKQKMSINTGELFAGTYFVILKTEGKNIKVEKLLILKD